MYECALRLGTEAFSPAGLRRQAQSYLACINALKLVKPEYAWIVKPTATTARQTQPSSSLPPGRSPKRTMEGEELMPTTAPRQKMEVLEMDEIEREFELVCARLKLSKLSPGQLSGPGVSAQETLSLLVSANLFESAVHLSGLFSLDPRPIVEGLASKCVGLARAGPAERDAAWEWLAENSGASTSADSANMGKDGRLNAAPVDAAWTLLQGVLERVEKPGQSCLHKAIAVRLCTLGCALPVWLETSFKKVRIPDQSDFKRMMNLMSQ